MALAELGEYLRKGTTYSTEAAAKIIDLKKMNEQAQIFAGQLSIETVKILPKILLLAQTGLSDLSSLRTEVFELFSQAALNSVKVIAKNLSKDLADDASVLLSGALAARIADVFEVVLNFEKKLNKTHPELSKEIISALSNAITLTLAVQCPAMALVFKFSGLTEGAQDLLDCTNLQKSISKLRGKVNELNDNENLAPIIKKAEILGSLSFDTGLDIFTLEKANLSKEKLLDIYQIRLDNNYPYLVQQLNEQAAKLPVDQEMLNKQIVNIKDALDKIVKQSSLDHPQIKENIDKKFDEATKILEGTLDKDQTLLKKIHAGNLLANKIKECIPKDTNQETKKAIISEIDKIINENLAIVSPSLNDSMRKSPALAREFGLTHAMKAAIVQNAAPSITRGK